MTASLIRAGHATAQAARADAVTSPFHEAAEPLFRAGWSVFPLPYQAKSPPPPGRTGASAPVSGEAELTADLAVTGLHNVGIRPAVGVLGIDVDAYVKGGVQKPGAATLAALEAELGPLPPTWRLTSRDDGISGIRLYGVRPASWPGILGPGIEVVSWHYRYAVAPPSIHPEGRPYRWIDPESNVSSIPPAEDDLPDLPVEWYDRFRMGNVEDAGRVDRHRLADHDDVQQFAERTQGEPCEPVVIAVEAHAAAIRAGTSRHEATLTGIWRTIALSAEGHTGGAWALDRIRATFDAAVADDPGRPTDREWRSMLLGAITAAVNRPWHDGDPCTVVNRLTGKSDAELAAMVSAWAAVDDDPWPSGVDRPPRVTREQLVEKEADRLRIRRDAQRRVRAEDAAMVAEPELTPLGAFLAVPDPALDYRVDGLLPAGGRVILTAQFKAGKTTLRDNLVRSLADGEAFLGRFLVRSLDGPIVVFDDEMDARQLRRWLREQGIVNTDAVVVVPLRGKVASFDLLDPDCRARWARKLRDVGARFVVLDCLRPVLDALGLSEDKEAGRFLVAFDALLDEADVDEAVVVHHAGHNSERSRGDSRLRDWPDVEWRLVRETTPGGSDSNGREPDSEPDARRYFSAYGRDVNVPEGLLTYEPATRRLSLAGGSRRQTAADDLLPDVLAYLRDNPGASQRTVVAALAGTENASQQRIRQALSRGLDLVVIQTRTGPRNALQHYVTGAQTGEKA